MRYKDVLEIIDSGLLGFAFQLIEDIRDTTFRHLGFARYYLAIGASPRAVKHVRIAWINSEGGKEPSNDQNVANVEDELAAILWQFKEQSSEFYPALLKEIFNGDESTVRPVINRQKLFDA
jgi:hypothetical protein